MEVLLLVTLIFLVLGLLAVAIRTAMRPDQRTEDVSTPLQNLTQLINNTQMRIELLNEKLAQVERNQNSADQRVVTMGTGLAETGAVARSIVDATNFIRDELSRAKNDLTALQSHTKARELIERDTAESIKRLEAIIAGTQSKGIAGENILELMFSRLPAEWQMRNFTVGNKTVEFGLRLPNNRILPIDSKWTATHLLEQFISCQDVNEQLVIKGKIEKVVIDKAKEVQKYIDTNLTVNFGVAVIPDAIYELCCGIHCDAFKSKVVLVSYSMFIPYLLLVVESAHKDSQTIDETKLRDYLHTAQSTIESLQREIEKRFSLALTMLDNSRTEIRGQLSKMSSGITGLQIGVNATLQVEEEQLPMLLNAVDSSARID
ncbi:MAG: recombination protein RmuC [Blastocatellia bacterium]|jgi:DNA recombination protein RmuC|nr:recombination protein RmuC [Blastocatellia bacterium]